LNVHGLPSKYYLCDEMDRQFVGIISTYAGLLPVLAGLIVFKKAGFKHRLLIVFLLYGFLTDLLVMITKDHQMMMLSITIFFLYILAEPMFFCWFISKSCDFQPVSKTAIILVLILPLPWVFSLFDFTRLTWKEDPSAAPFGAFFKMIVTILASYAILRLTRKDEKLSAIPDFWFLFAMFFYCICTFFMFLFIQNPYMPQFWFLHNILNIMTYFIYSFGFLKIETKSGS
jgi:hypothetical protein